MAEPADPINIPILGVSRDQNISLGIFLTQALQNPDWQEIKVKLPLKDEPLSLNRHQCREILKQKILPDVFQKDPDFYNQVEDLQNPESLDLLGNHLIDQEIPGQTDPRTQQIKEGYKLFMQNQAAGALTDPQTPAQILAVSEARNTAKAINQIQIQLSDKIGLAVEGNLQKYPDSYRRQIKQSLTEHITHEALSELSSKNGRLTDETGNLNPHFANRVSHLFKTNPTLRAAIVNSQDFDQSLEKNLTGTDQQAAQEAYNNFRKFQITAGPQYHQLANKLSPYLNNAEITRVISRLEGIPPGSNPLAIRQNLAAALSPYQNKLIKGGVNTTRLTNDLTTGFQFFLNNPTTRAGHHFHYPAKLRKLAKKMGIKDFQSPEEFQKLQALYAYTGGYSSEELRQLKEKGKILKTGRHGEIKINDSLVEKVKAFENKQTHGPLRRWSAEGKTQKMHNKSVKRKEKAIKHEIWQKKIDTKWYGWFVKPQKKIGKAFEKTKAGQAWAEALDNFRENSKFSWLLSPKWRARKAVGNWIINKYVKGKMGNAAAEKVATVLITKGFRSASVEILKNSILKIGTKLGLRAISQTAVAVAIGNVVGLVVGIVLTAKDVAVAIYETLKDPETFKKVLNTMAFGGAAVVYLLFKLITTYPLTCLGAAFGMSFGPMGAAIGGFIGLIGDKIIGGLKGVASHLANTSAAAWEAAASLPSTAAGIPVGFTAVAVPVIAPLIITFIAAWFTISTIASALANPYGGSTGGKGMPASEITNFAEVEDFPYEESIDLMASQLAQIAEDCVGVDGIVNQDSWEKFRACLEAAGIEDNVIQELDHSVNELPDNENLQCVGFVLAARASENLPHQNAVAFLYNHPGLSETNTPQKGDIAVWGASNCKGASDQRDANDFCQNDSSCCGHVGIFNKIENGLIYITSAWGESGEINTKKIPVTSDNIPWMYLH